MDPPPVHILYVEGAARWTNAMPTVAGRVGSPRYSLVWYSYEYLLHATCKFGMFLVERHIVKDGVSGSTLDLERDGVLQKFHPSQP